MKIKLHNPDSRSDIYERFIGKFSVATHFVHRPKICPIFLIGYGDDWECRGYELISKPGMRILIWLRFFPVVISDCLIFDTIASVFEQPNILAKLTSNDLYWMVSGRALKPKQQKMLYKAIALSPAQSQRILIMKSVYHLSKNNSAWTTTINKLLIKSAAQSGDYFEKMLSILTKAEIRDYYLPFMPTDTLEKYVIDNKLSSSHSPCVLEYIKRKQAILSIRPINEN